MAITRKNRSLKKKATGLKKKSNKSRKNSKKSQNKRKIRGGMFGATRKAFGLTLSQNDFIEFTKNLRTSRKPISDKVDDYIAATIHISQCDGEKSCETDKFVSYTHRWELGQELIKEPGYNNDVSEEKKVALENQIDVWGKLAAEKRRKSLPPGENTNSSVEIEDSSEKIINEAGFPTK